MTTRKDFIAAGAALAALPGVAAAAPAPHPSPSHRPIPKLSFDLPAFDAILERTVPHKHLFTAREFSSGDVFTAVRSTLNAYASIDVPAAQVAPITVFYHGPAIAFGFDDYAWRTFFLPYIAATKSSVKFADDAKSIVEKDTNGNPMLRKQSGEWDGSIPTLVAQANLHMFVCNNALGGFSDAIGAHLKRDPSTVYEDLRAHLLPSATLVPAGVWAIHYAQQKGYTLLQTS
ncbi:MAG TPA: hypothetical protein VFN49_08905 [Candidatus Aquilonibacter sp.]|nr:hypothetical protein [Candidatus Aquilonibacter sp.]